MTVKSRLSKAVIRKIELLEDEMREFIVNQRLAMSEMSDEWQETERAVDMDAWVERLEELADALSDTNHEVF